MAVTQSLYKQEYVNLLRKGVESKTSLDLYKRDNCPFEKNMIFKLIGVEKAEGLNEQMIQTAGNDYNAAILLYEKYRNLTPLQASDDRLWVYMAHVDLYGYMRQRYRLEDIVLRRKPDGTMPLREDAEQEFILQNWFGTFMRQGISNLWWSVYQTIDKDREDVYELTRYMFQHYDFRTRRFASSVFARNREGMIGLLSGMMQLDTYKESFESRSNFAIMYFNHLGGTRQLTALSRYFFMEELLRIDPEVQKYKTRDDIRNNKDHLFDNL